MFKQITEGLCCQKEGQYTLTYSIPKKRGKVWRSLRSCRKSIPERHRKSDASQGEQNMFSFYHHKEDIRSFPTMYNTWGCSLGRNGPQQIFSPKKWSKNTHVGGHGPGSSNFGVGWNISFEMSYGQGVKLQYCPIHLNFFQCQRENMLKIDFFIKGSFLEICSKKKISRIGPCETSRHDVSENVELIGRVRFWMGVIGRQRWMSPKKLVRHGKYET